MNTNNSPGFRAENSLYKERKHYRAKDTQSSGTGTPQLRIAGGGTIGGGTITSGLARGWGTCLVCTADCSLLSGGEVLACLEACYAAGACD